MFLHICFVSLCVCGRVSLQRRANIEVTGIYKKTAKTAVFFICRSSLFFLRKCKLVIFSLYSFFLVAVVPAPFAKLPV
ncbi:hypothetical protein DW150_15155 [Phocaeicola vulgatus]|uniref:Uncharacterized protein n=1 Tax=Phocaeicola vulgatus TaxID=821 RepID=A0A415BP82_PHOVU|nr:hypothetical protein DW150_15155 [Phocaeicola vulgatus]